MHVYKKFVALKATGGVRQDSNFVMQVVVPAYHEHTVCVCIIEFFISSLWIDRAAVCSTHDFFTSHPQSTMISLLLLSRRVP